MIQHTARAAHAALAFFMDYLDLIKLWAIAVVATALGGAFYAYVRPLKIKKQQESDINASGLSFIIFFSLLALTLCSLWLIQSSCLHWGCLGE